MSDDFDWADTSTIIPEQPQTAVYLNPHGQIVIRQRQWPEDDDQYVYVSPESVGLLVRAIMDAAGIETPAPSRALPAPSRDTTGAARQRRYRGRRNGDADRNGDRNADRDGERDVTVPVTVEERNGAVTVERDGERNVTAPEPVTLFSTAAE